VKAALSGVTGVSFARTAPRRLSRGFVPTFKRHPGAVLAAVYLFILIAVAALAPLIAPYDPAHIDLLHGYERPSGAHWLGTDQLGRDILSRLIYGGRVSLLVAIAVVSVSFAVALPIGLYAGFRSGIVDAVTMRVTDAGLSIPPIILAIALAAMMGPSLTTTIIALAIVSTPMKIRFVRGEALARRQETYVEASLVAGTPSWRILRDRLLPNVRPAVIVLMAFQLGTALLAEASLSYLGVGVQPPTPSWGNMLRQAYDAALFTHPYQLVVPGAAIATTILAFYTLADGLRDALGLARKSDDPVRRRHGMTIITAAPDPVPDDQARSLLSVQDMTVTFGKASPVTVVNDVSLEIGRGEIVGLVGESGSGKTVTALSILQLLPSPPARIGGGSIRLDGEQLLTLDRAGLSVVRGRRIGMIFQDPMTSLDPCMKVGKQVMEAYLLHNPKASWAEARARAIELFRRVRIPAPESRMESFPHEMSGGMRQRVMLALALACDPELLIADEPTTALDVTVQEEVLELIKELQQNTGMSVLIVTHDLAVVAETCDRVIVMYAGEVVETNATRELFSRPAHPYTAALLASIPQLDHREERLATIPGRVPLAGAFPTGCRFHPRCAFAVPACAQAAPMLRNGATAGSAARCHRMDEISDAIARGSVP
jgi:peptide/nickel transport system permease protein